MRLRFGDLTFDGGRRQLYRGPEPVHLTPKAFQLLELLLKRRPEAIAKPEIHELLWPATFVSESNLASLMNEVRRALGDKGREASFVRTVHGFGYAFDGVVREVPDLVPATRRHVLVWGKQELDLSPGQNVIGRERTATIWVNHSSVSRAHACVVVTDDGATIEDLGSKNGTFRLGERVSAPAPLADGDELRVGCVTLIYTSSPAEVSTDTISV